MHHNSFLNGILHEIKQIEKQANLGMPARPSVSPAIAPAPPIQARPKVQQPLNLGIQGKNNPQVIQAQKSWLNMDPSLRSNIIGHAAYTGAHSPTGNIAGNLAQVPGQIKQEQGNNVLNSLKQFNPSQALQQYNAGSGAQEFGSQFGKLSPQDQLRFIQETSHQDPELAGAFRGTAGDQIRNNVDHSSMTDLLSSHGNNANPIRNAAMADPQIKSYANQQGMHRMGNLTGEWLSNNWKSIAGVLGGGVALTMLYKLLSQHSQNQQPSTVINNYNQPKFL